MRASVLCALFVLCWFALCAAANEQAHTPGAPLYVPTQKPDIGFAGTSAYLASWSAAATQRATAHGQRLIRVAKRAAAASLADRAALAAANKQLAASMHVSAAKKAALQASARAAHSAEQEAIKLAAQLAGQQVNANKARAVTTAATTPAAAAPVAAAAAAAPSVSKSLLQLSTSVSSTPLPATKGASSAIASFPTFTQRGDAAAETLLRTAGSDVFTQPDGQSLENLTKFPLHSPRESYAEHFQDWEQDRIQLKPAVQAPAVTQQSKPAPAPVAPTAVTPAKAPTPTKSSTPTRAPAPTPTTTTAQNQTPATPTATPTKTTDQPTATPSTPTTKFPWWIVGVGGAVVLLGACAWLALASRAKRMRAQEAAGNDQEAPLLV